MPTTNPKQFNTSEAGRAEVARFFTEHLKRHDFTRYINEHLAADFACALAPTLHAIMAKPAQPISVEEKAQQAPCADGLSAAWNTVRKEARSVAGGRSVAALLSAVDSFGTACAALGRTAHPSALHALQRIADWNEHTVAFAVDQGSNGVQAHYRRIAREAIENCAAAPETVAVQEVWQAAGGNPSIKATKAELLKSVYLLERTNAALAEMPGSASIKLDPDAELVAYIVAELWEDEYPISRVEPGLPQFFIDTPEGDELLLTDELRAKVEQALGEPLVERVQQLRDMKFTRLVPKSKAGE